MSIQNGQRFINLRDEIDADEDDQERITLTGRDNSRNDGACEAKAEDVALYCAVERIAQLEARVERLTNELENRSHEPDMMASDAYHHCSDMIDPYASDQCGPDTLIPSVCESVMFLIREWRAKAAVEGRLKQFEDAALAMKDQTGITKRMQAVLDGATASEKSR